MSTENKYRMTVSLNVIDDLGKRLYSNVPAVLSELIANSYDADANEVRVTISENTIVIEDDGEGMSLNDINNHFLTIGYKRRKSKQQPTKTTKYGRDVMGRKGIGKLAVFAIAKEIKIYSKKDDEHNGLLLSSEKIMDILEGNQYSEYHPEDIPYDYVPLSGENGTKIILSNLINKSSSTPQNLKKRVARRFSIFGEDFKVYINEDLVSFADRDYFHKIQYLWSYSGHTKEKDPYYQYCNPRKIEEFFSENNITNQKKQVSGWIGTVVLPNDLKDEDENINKITIMARKKLIQENILDDFNDGGLYTKYLIGEIHAEFLDEDDSEDLATSNRQALIKDDPRYEDIKAFVWHEMKKIDSAWTNLRNKDGEKRAKMIPPIEEWYNRLQGDERKEAKKLFGKINQVNIKDEEERKTLFKHCVLAFESSRHKKALRAFSLLDHTDLQAIVKLFDVLNDIDATLYYQIIRSRLEVIDTFRKHAEEGALEKVLQEKLYDNLWLLDPSWDRSTENPSMEESFGKYLKRLEKHNPKIPKKLLRSRYDIKYKTPANKHVIIELKKADKKLTSDELMTQVKKYDEALKLVLKEIERSNETREIICLVGQKPVDWIDDESEKKSIEAFKVYNARIIRYNKLLSDAYDCYKVYLEIDKEANAIQELLQKIEDS